MSERLAGKVAIVTGSSGGIGEGIARSLAAAGASVVVSSYRSEDEGRAVAASLPGATYVGADVRDAAAVRHLVDATVERYGRLDILVNNAGAVAFFPRADLDGLTDEMWQEMLDANLLGPWHTIQAAAPHLRASGDGAIINITSLDGLTAKRARGSVAYAVSKAALNHLTKLMAMELAPEIRVNAIAPGLVPSRIELAPESLERFLAAAPLQRVGKPSDIGALCVALAEPGFATGQIIVADGGVHLG